MSDNLGPVLAEHTKRSSDYQSPFAPKRPGSTGFTSLNTKSLEPNGKLCKNKLTSENEFRAFQMLELRLQGYNIGEIAQYFDMGPVDAQRYMQAALEYIRTEYKLGTEALREIEEARTEQLIREHWPHKGQVKHAELLLKIMGHRSALLNLNVKAKEEDNTAEALRNFLVAASDSIGIRKPSPEGDSE